MRTLRLLVLLALLPPLSGCFGYRLMRPDEITVPSYEPREVVVPPECDALVRQAAASLDRLSEAEARRVVFCQNQQLLRSQEEEAAARKLEAHAAAGRFVLQLTTVVVGMAIAVLAWIF